MRSAICAVVEARLKLAGLELRSLSVSSSPIGLEMVKVCVIDVPTAQRRKGSSIGVGACAGHQTEGAAWFGMQVDKRGVREPNMCVLARESQGNLVHRSMRGGDGGGTREVARAACVKGCEMCQKKVWALRSRLRGHTGAS
eukprot:2275583-Pleurochrysis_carterae.AAC.5